MTEAELIIKEHRDILNMVERKRKRIQSKIDKLPFLPEPNASKKTKDKFDLKLRRLRRRILIWNHLSWWLRQLIEEMEEENRKLTNKSKIIMERKIGEIFEFDGVKLKVVDIDNIDSCKG